MSTINLPDRPPRDEIAKRAAESGGGLAAAVKGIEVQHHAANRAAWRKRVNDSHKQEMELLGMSAEQMTDQGASDVGDVIVTGDIYGDQAMRVLRDTTADSAPPNTAPQETSLLAKTLPYVLAAALGAGGGVGVPWSMGLFDNATPPTTDTDTQYILELVPNEEVIE